MLIELTMIVVHIYNSKLKDITTKIMETLKFVITKPKDIMKTNRENLETDGMI